MVLIENNYKNILINVGKDSLQYIPSYIVPPLFAFLGLSLYTRLFSPNLYGQYILIYSTTAFLGSFTYSWINQAGIRFFSTYKDKGSFELFISTYFYSLAATLFFSTIALLILSKLSLLPQFLHDYLSLVIYLIITTAFFEVLISLLRAKRKAKTISIARCIASISSLTISLILIFTVKLGISAILIGQIITNLVLSSVFFVYFGYHKHIRFRHISMNIFKIFFAYGIPLTMNGLFAWTLALSDRYLIEFLRGSGEVGIYSATYQLIESPISLISSIVIMASFPIIVDTWEKYGDELTSNTISSIMKYHLLVSAPLVICIILLAPEIIRILGNNYYAGTKIIPWVCLGTLVLGITPYFNKGFELQKKTKLLSLIIGFSALSNILMNLLLIPRYGYYGAGIATFLAYMINLFLTALFSQKYLKMCISKKTILTILLASITMWISAKTLVFIHESTVSLLLAINFGLVTYLIVVYIAKEIDVEIIFLKKIINYYINIIRDY